MIIGTQAIPALPRAATRAMAKLPAGGGPGEVTRLSGLRLGGPVYHVALGGGIPALVPGAPRRPLSGPQRESGLELLRLGSKLVADHLGQKGMAVHYVLWTVVDAKTLHDHWHDPGQDTTGRALGVLKVAGGALGALGAVPGGAGADAAATTLSFVADCGGSIHQGQITLNAADLAEYAGDAAGHTADYLHLTGALTGLFNDSAPAGPKA